MPKSTYKTGPEGNPVGYFSFPEDQEERTEDGEESLQFTTTNEPHEVDDNPPPELYDSLEELFAEEIPELEIGHGENLHFLPKCDPEAHEETIETIRRVLTAAGWQEVDLAVTEEDKKESLRRDQKRGLYPEHADVAN